MTLLKSLACVALAVIFAACTSKSSDADSADEGALGEASSPTITFPASGAPKLSGRLVAGARVKLVYDESRLGDCRGGFNDGSPAWIIGAYASLNGGAPEHVRVAGHDPDGTPGTVEPSVLVKEGGDLALWFQVTNRWGCSAWDSDYGANFHFNVEGPRPGSEPPAPHKKVHFAASGPPVIDGEVVAGDALEIDYDPSRLPQCRGTRNDGSPAWGIVGYSSANDAPARPFYVAGLNARGAQVPPIIPVPDAGKVALWFEVVSSFGCHEWDSNLSANYIISVRGR